MIIAVKTNQDPKITSFNKKLKNKLLKPSNLVTNPVEGGITSFKHKQDNITVLSIKILTFPIYLLFFISVLLYVVFPGKLSMLCIIITGIFSIPFTSLFWQLVYWYGLKKHKYKGKIRFFNPSKAWGYYNGTD